MTQKIQIYLQMSIFFRNVGTPLPCGRVPPKVQCSNAGHLGDCFSAEKYRCAITFLCRSTCPYASISRHSCTKKCTTVHIFLRKSLQMSIFFR